MHSSGNKKEAGLALLFALLAILLILAGVAFVVYRAQSAKRFTDVAVYMADAEEACRAGIDYAIEQVWHTYVVGQGNTTGNLASYRQFLDAFVLPNEDVNGNGERDGDEDDTNGNGTFDVNPAWYLVSSDDDPMGLPSGSRITEIVVERLDDLTGADLTIRVTAEKGGVSRSAVQTLRVAGELFSGFEYGILANNINCILCHAQILPLDMVRNEDSDLYGTFDRIKVAALESLMVRSGSDHFGAHSTVAGTVYTRGTVYNQNGYTYSSSGLASTTFRSAEFSDENGALSQNSSGDLTSTPFANGGTGADGLLEPFANLYVNYPTDEAQMTDGDLPTSFPAPFPDENGDRCVNDDEFQTVLNSADGSVTGGVIYGLPEGTAYADTALPTSSNAAATALASGTYDGNLILIGTEDDPLVIDSKVAVNGDLVIKGEVKGWGQLQVRGNTYIIGDVTYADAEDSFGMADDGTTNGLAVASGGSILVGDYLTIWCKDDRSTSNMWYEEWIDMRAETKTNSTPYGGVDVGYFDDGVVDPGYNATSGRDADSFTTSELMLFNGMEYTKAQADATYTPRYYRIRPSQPIFTWEGYGQDAMWYEASGIETVPDEDLVGSAIHDLNPRDFWLSEDQLRQFWYADEMSRPDTGRALQFDGLLYSNNCIFCVTHSKQYHNSNTYGRMVIRGGVIAADLGVFVPGPNTYTSDDALKLYYDRRVNDFLRVEDTSQVEFSRTVFRYL
ncbi:MAG: hypothetical protein JXR94_00310 [Candidatus Hydrogenedentes bacterium]|nr:hypothetical protein [Candidatus Hydrogenedentota bacterium]